MRIHAFQIRYNAIHLIKIENIKNFTQIALHVVKCVPRADIHIGESLMGLGGEGRRRQVGVAGTVAALRIGRVERGVVAVVAAAVVAAVGGVVAGGVDVLWLADVGRVDGGGGAGGGE